MNGKYVESAHWFSEYLKQRPGDTMALRKLEFLQNVDKYATTNDRFMISSFGLNTEHSELGAHFFHDGLVYASSQDKDLFIKHKSFDALSPEESLLNLYYAELNNKGEWQSFTPFHPKRLKTNYHDGPMAFYDDFRKGAFTQSNQGKDKPVTDANGRVNLKIYFAEVAHLGEFGNVIPFEHNSDEYSNAHPSFSADGKVMYFSSTMSTGYGNSDLYYSVYENGRWTEPVNLGSEVNTREDESFPFIANDTTLYFSSNGHGTLGGLDLYVSYRRNGNFGKPINLGSPMNTRFDDFSLVCDKVGRAGYIASNREGGKGQDDIYWYTANFYLLAGRVRELSRGQEIIPGAKILAYNSNGDLIDSTRSDSDGYFTLDLPFDQDFMIRGEKEGFETLEDLAFSSRGKPYGVDSLMLPMWKLNLFARGRIFSNETQSVLPGVAVTLHDITNGTTDTLMVDESGEYRFLVRPGRKYWIEGNREGYLSNGFSLDTKGLLEGELLNDIVLEEIYIEKEVILFDYDKDDISEASARLLNRIVRTLKKFGHATVNVGAHADARGTRQYNARLSKERAEATRDYLLSRGVPASRMQLSWFGEELVLNSCSDGVECHEDDHSKNRRAEIKIQMTPIN